MKVLVLAAALTSLICSAAAAEPALFSDAPAQKLRPLGFSGALIKVEEGRVWLRRGSAVTCDMVTTDDRWRAGRYGDVNRLGPVFESELQRAGLKSVEANNLFESDRTPGTILVGAIINDVQVRQCGNVETWLARMMFHASATMTVEWQVYDPLRKEMLLRTSTTGIVSGGYDALGVWDQSIVAAFRENARLLLAKSEMVALAHVPAELPDARAKAADRTTLLLALAKDSKVAMRDATGAVVTVFNGVGQGSGFLISADGYLLTARHVVGDAKLVKLRWSDGFETEGEVLRSDKRRDVALIKSSAHSRAPLPLRIGRVNPGDTVFAIGSPLETKYEGTVSRGVVSAYRIQDGLNMLQSDVMINHGNSGGPLLDERGAVVGISDAGLFPNGDQTPVGINFFVPIGDALDFLAIKAAP